MKRVIVCLLLASVAGCGSEPSQQSGEESVKPAPPAVDIFTAAGEGNLEAVKQHIAAGTDLNQRMPDDQKSTPLIIASTFGRLEAAKALIAAKANLNLQNKDGTTALSAAAFLCHTEIVQALLENGADPNIKNKDGITALAGVLFPWHDIKPFYDLLNGTLFQPAGMPLDYERIQATRSSVAQLLRQSGGKAAAPAGNLNANKQQNAAKPALRTWKDASGSFSIEAVFVRVTDDKVVLKRTDQKEMSVPLVSLSVADRQYVQKQDSSPPAGDIFTAAGEGNLEAVKQHIAAGTDLNQRAPDDQKSTPLMIASTFGRVEAAQALIAAKVNLDLQNKDGNTALSIAAFLCHTDIVQALLEKGANKNIRNKDGITALDGVQLPWDVSKPIYELLNGIVFQPAGMPLDYERIEATRPRIAKMLR